MLTDDADAGRHDRRRARRRQPRAPRHRARGRRNAAEAALRELPDEVRAAPAIVVAGEGWHPGVVGIVASRHRRAARQADDRPLDRRGGRGARLRPLGRGLRSARGRSTPCSATSLATAATGWPPGWSFAPSSIDAFRDAPSPPTPRPSIPEGGLGAPERIDAVVGAEALDLDVAEQLDSLRPSARAIRTSACWSRARASATCGRWGRRAATPASTCSAAGSPPAGSPSTPTACSSAQPGRPRPDRAPGGQPLERRGRAASRARRRLPASGATGAPRPRMRGRRGRRLVVGAIRARARPRPRRARPRRARRGRRARGFSTRAGAPRSPGSPSCSRAGRGCWSSPPTPAVARRSPTSWISVGGGRPATVCIRCSAGRAPRPAADPGCSLLADRLVVARRGAGRGGRGFEHVVAVDPPSSPALRCARARRGRLPARGVGPGAEDIAEPCWDAEWSLRGALAEVYRALAAVERADGRRLARSCAGRGGTAAPPRRRPAAPASSVRSASRRSAGAKAPAGSGSYPRNGPNSSDQAPGAPARRSTKRGANTCRAEERNADQQRRGRRERCSARACRDRADRPRPRRRRLRERERRPPRLPIDEFTRDLTERERELLGDLLAVIAEHEPGDGSIIDRETVERAFAFACERHADQRRRSGEEFVSHPVEVAKICAGLRLDTETLCAALLHDTVEDTSASLEDVSERFGDPVAHLVDGVTKLTGITFESRDESQAENYRKMMVAMSADVRVILIKLADRLHNMRTIGVMPKQKQVAKSRETLEIYAPLAHRLESTRSSGSSRTSPSRSCTRASTTRSRSWSTSSRRAREPWESTRSSGSWRISPSRFSTHASTTRSRSWSTSSSRSGSATSPTPASSSTASSGGSGSTPRSPGGPSTSTRSTRR